MATKRGQCIRGSGNPSASSRFRRMGTDARKKEVALDCESGRTNRVALSASRAVLMATSST